jgi:hypothetical protein
MGYGPIRRRVLRVVIVPALSLRRERALSAFALWQERRKKQMMRSMKATAAAAFLFVVPTVASALGISIVDVTTSGASTSVLQPGETITFDLRLENGTNEQINSLEVLVSGFDTPGTTPDVSSGLQLVGGAVATSAFDAITGFGGLTNIRTAPTTRWQLNLFNPEEVRTSLFTAASTTSASGSGSLDNGIDGDLIGNGDVHFRVTYQLMPTTLATQNIVLNFGTNADYGAIAVGPTGETLAFQNATYGLTVIPEPGTALLMGLGLAGLATRRR